MKLFPIFEKHQNRATTKHTTTTMLNRNERAKLAKLTMSKTIPDLLKHNTRALAGIQNAELIRFKSHHDTPHKRSSSMGSGDATMSTSLTQATSPAMPTVTVIKSDSYDAVHSIQSTFNANTAQKTRICVLNMASALNPGGGVINGSLAQEESLCLRSTLYASLEPSWYRLPDLSCIYTPSVLVFRDANLQPLKLQDQYYVDVISVAAPKNPELMKIINKEGEEEWIYAYNEDKELMMAKIRGMFDVCMEKGVTHLVLGALGCGAYHNPPREVARMFRRCVEGDRKHRGVGIIEGMGGISEIYFAIFDEGANLEAFREVFPTTDAKTEPQGQPTSAAPVTASGN
jgi:uncharacterized protein (TIGR02452 family)